MHHVHIFFLGGGGIRVVSYAMDMQARDVCVVCICIRVHEVTWFFFFSNSWAWNEIEVNGRMCGVCSSPSPTTRLLYSYMSNAPLSTTRLLMHWPTESHDIHVDRPSSMACTCNDDNKSPLSHSLSCVLGFRISLTIGPPLCIVRVRKKGIRTIIVSRQRVCVVVCVCVR